ncbi:DUF6378 domain-containing protein [Rhodococcus opacus]|uniref:DUF6378 domain-containing protein n=1 Tax=Rhodococcus opacus TaxID=37919 RepID=UPI001C47FCE8|nr:DUF6378 domain-containing protein [Rhodococcus opacus]MBV6758370.1 hypothetical protein [Rhodococcus opacus]
MNTPTLTAEDVMSRLSDAIGGGKLEAALAQANAQMAQKAAQLNGDVAEQVAAAETTPEPEGSWLDGLSDPGNDTPAEWAEAQARAASMAAHPAGKGRQWLGCGNGDAAEAFAAGGIVDAPQSVQDFAQEVANYDDAEQILADAANIVGGDRDVDYGPPERNLGRIAGMWSAYLDVEITPRDVAWMMVHVKSSRDRNRKKRDNLVDGVGYLALAGTLPAA